MNNTEKASIQLIETSCKQIRVHLNVSYNNDYDWRPEILDSISTIETELEYWLKQSEK